MNRIAADMIWLDPAKAVCVGLSYSWSGDYPFPLQAKRIKHPDLPGTRWMRRARKGTSQMFYSLIRDARFSRDDCYLLPTQQQWDEKQERSAPLTMPEPMHDHSQGGAFCPHCSPMIGA